jgi:hypothetical protein
MSRASDDDQEYVERSDARLCARVLWDWIGSNKQSAPMAKWADRWPWLMEND